MTSPTTWMTYAEAGEALGIAPSSVKQRARRGRWARQAGNDGLARVAVPNELLEAKPATPLETKPDTSTETSPATNAVHEALARLEGEVAGLRAAVEAERRRADLAEVRANELREDRDRWHAAAMRPWWKRLVG